MRTWCTLSQLGESDIFEARRTGQVRVDRGMANCWTVPQSQTDCI